MKPSLALTDDESPVTLLDSFGVCEDRDDGMMNHIWNQRPSGIDDSACGWEVCLVGTLHRFTGSWLRQHGLFCVVHSSGFQHPTVKLMQMRSIQSLDGLRSL